MNKTPENTERELGSPEAWENARVAAEILGAVPSSFSVCVRFLIQDFTQNNNVISHTSKYNLRRLLKSPNFLAPLYFAARTFYPEKRSEFYPFTHNTLANIFSAQELAHIVALLFVYRKLHKHCDKEQWQFVAESVHVFGEIGGLVGQAIPRIGLARGMVLGAMRHLGKAMFLRVDKKGFTQHRRKLKIENMLHDLDEELKRWHCTHIQIGSILIQTLGLGVSFADSFVLGLSGDNINDPVLTKEATDIRVANFWIESLFQECKVPDITHKGEYYPLTDALEKLLELVELTRQNGSSYSWLEKTAEDITPQTCPELFKAEKPITADLEPLEEAPTEELIDEQISEDEWL